MKPTTQLIPRLALAGLLLLEPGRLALIAADGANPVPNGSFETAAGDRPRGWRPERWAGEGLQSYAEAGHSGGRSVLLSSEKGADIGWAASVPVEPAARYRLSGWIKTENVQGARGALFNIHDLQPIATPAVSGTKDWTRVTVEFETEDQEALQVNCLLGGWGLATGKAWYDDVTVELIGRKEMPRPTVAIDATAVGEPISKYIYGQFIEHLGRCIYGGIWAEMLQDRKFYFAVGAKESPWRALGSAERVTMITERPFVGEHTPQIQAAAAAGAAPHGIVHAGLALEPGAKYQGRIWLAGDGAAAPVQISLVWGDRPQDRDSVTVRKLTPEFARTTFKFKAGAATGAGRLEITAAGRGAFRVGTVSLMPADNIHGMRADTLARLKELNSPVYRWPGGNFVSGYNWKDGIGDPDRRPPRKNPAWTGVEHNDFGLDEFMVFCRWLGTEPYIAVNSGLGGVESALEELQYANGLPETPMGQWRARNGHRAAYGVTWWGIGNEMYGDWQLGHMSLADYVKKHNQFAQAFRKGDPAAKLVAVGDAGPWSEGMMKYCAEHMDLISEHFYCQERPGLSAHVRQIPEAVRRKAEAHRQYRRDFPSLKGTDIRIALDEWNYWYGPHVFGELGTRYFLKDGLGIAAGLHEYARQSDIIFMANYAQTVNVIGAIKVSPTNAALETTGLVLKLYRQHFGELPVATRVTGALDAQAAWSRDRRQLTLGLVNPTRREVTVPLDLKGVRLTGSGQRWEIAGTDPQAYNDPDQPAQVVVAQKAVRGFRNEVTLPPCSVTVLSLQAARP